jgi:hypothetical protein
MAIGSQGEIGTTFSALKDYESFEAYLAWARAWREYVGDDLLGGYGTLIHPSRKDSYDSSTSHPTDS